MKLLFGIFLIIFAVSLFVLNFSLGVFTFTDFKGLPFLSGEEESTLLDRLAEKIEEGKESLSVQELQKKITIPVPIKVFQNTSQEFLNPHRVFIATNAQRQQQGLTPFFENETLDKIAQVKVQDMFQSQYFEHESPGGILFTDLADIYGYEYLSMGENLAFGHYESEEALVQAWMDSPGHRENILHAKYQEIGIALQKGNFKGQEVWMAVQTFGLALSTCPVPKEDGKAEIDLKKVEVEALQGFLDFTKEELDNMQPKHGNAYGSKINEFNTLVEQYNTTVLETQKLITEYNKQVEIFNQCADSGK
jgi:uncharacterized protein YkwD